MTACPRCTFLNGGGTTATCSVCGYRLAATFDDVEVTGVEQSATSPPTAVAASWRAPTNRRYAAPFDPMTLGYDYTTDRKMLPGASRSGRQNTKRGSTGYVGGRRNIKKPKVSEASAENPPPMRAGESKMEVTFRNTLNVPTQLLVPQQATLLSAALEISQNMALNWLRAFRKKKHEEGSTFSLWDAVTACATDHGVKAIEAPTRRRPDSIDEEVWELIRNNLSAYLERDAFVDEINAILPVQEGTRPEAATLDCCVCFESFHIQNTVYCEGCTMHSFCRKCFHQYVTKTVPAGTGISQIPCAEPSCQALFATGIVQRSISKWDQLRLADKEEERNCKVALAAKAVLKCVCGAVGVIMEEDVGNSCVDCPGCSKRYCVKCGNERHDFRPCPPPKETVRWLSKMTRLCPQCRQPIEKNGGCDHMHCSPPEGCGHHFTWSQALPPPTS